MLKFFLVAVLFAVAVYLLVRVVQRRGLRGPGNGGSGGTGRPGGPGGRPGPPRPLGPDDDPDFLWRLDRDKRHPRKDDGGPQPG